MLSIKTKAIEGTLSAKWKMMQCDICRAEDFRTKATHMCVNCAKQMCNGCTGKHSSDPLLYHHQVIQLAPTDTAALQCSSHANETLQHYCTTCRTPICTVCALYVHDDHNKQSLHAYVTTQRQHLEMLLEESDLKQKCAAQTQREMEGMLGTLEEEMEEAREMMEHNYRMLIQALDRKHTMLHKRLSEKYKGKIRE